jgi:hypothetical protein
MLKDGVSYRELGGRYFDRPEQGRLTRHYLKRLEALGHKITLGMLVPA